MNRKNICDHVQEVLTLPTTTRKSTKRNHFN